MLIPPVVLYLIWQRRDRIGKVPFEASWAGAAVLVLGLLIVFIGRLSTLHTVTQYGYLVALTGGAWAIMGWQAFRIVTLPILLLFLMVPLPHFLYQGLSSQLQLISSEIGVGFIRLFGISVFLE